MPNEKQDLMNHRQTALACKNYTDKEIKASEERILSIVARNNVDFIDHINEPTYRFTAPANAKLLTLQSIAGNSNKIAPSTPSDDSVARLKTIPENTYKSQFNYIGGKSVKYNQLIQNNNFSENSGWNGNNATISIANNKMSVTPTAKFGGFTKSFNTIATHKYLITGQVTLSSTGYETGIYISQTSGNIDFTLFPQVTTKQNFNYIFTATNTQSANISSANNGDSDWTTDVYEYVNIYDLTDIFGAGNEPSDVATAIPLLKANGYKLDGTDTYSTGSLKHAVVSEVKYNPINLFNINDLNTNLHTITINNNHSFTISQVDSSNIFTTPIQFRANTQYTFKYSITRQMGNHRLMVFYTDGTYDIVLPLGITTNATFTTASGKTISSIGASYGDVGYVDYEYLMIIEGTTAPSTYIPYVAPITKAIPSEVLALDGYGMGRSGAYNYIDFNAKKFNASTYTQVFTGQEDDWSLRSGNSHTFAIACNKFPKRPKNDRLQNATTETFGWTKLEANEIDTKDGVYTDYTGQFIVTVMSCSTLAEFQTYLASHILAINYDVTQVKTDVSQYFTDSWNKVDLDKQYATCEMVVAEPIDMPNKVEYYGTIIHSLATAVKQDGFNLFDKNATFIDGYCDGSGVFMSNTDMKSIVLKVIPNQTYYFYTNNKNGDMQRFAFAKENPTISSEIYSTATIRGFNNYNNGTITTIPTNMNYMVVTFFRTSTATNTLDEVINNLCINISNQTLNGTYKPYKAPITRLLPNSEAKYSWGITDGVRNTRVFCDDECNPVNKGQLDVGNQDLGGLTYTKDTNRIATLGLADFLKDIASTDTYNLLCPNYIASSFNDACGHTSDYLIGVRYTTKELSIWDNYWYNNWNATAFKSSMDGVPLFYEKNTTDTETLDDFDYFFDCEEGDTFTLVNTEQLQCYATYSFLIKEAKSNE